MPISFNCSCGEKLEVDDEFAGKQARCPYCEAVVNVPAANAPPPAKRAKLAEPKDTDDDHGAYAGSLNPLDNRNRPSSRRRRDDDEDDRPSSRRRRDEDEDERPSRRRRDDDEDEDRPSRRRRDEDEDDDDYRPRRRRRSEPPPYNAFNKSTIGGAIAIIVGIALFVVGLYFELVCLRLVLILVIAGLIGLIRGLVTGRDG